VLASQSEVALDRSETFLRNQDPHRTCRKTPPGNLIDAVNSRPLLRTGRSLNNATPVDDHTPPIGCDFDGDYFEALSELDGGSHFRPADIGALRDPCHRKSTLPGRRSFVSYDRKYGHRIGVQKFTY
jgi:hypothetical protein